MILQQIKIPDFINIEILIKYVISDIDNNKNFFDDCNIAYKISDPKKAEWILHKSISGSKLVSNGSNNIDIEYIDYNNINFGIDVSVLTMNNNISNEKSIM